MKAITALSVALAATFAVPSNSTPADEAAEQGILLLGNGSEPHSLDPHINSTMNGHHVMTALLEGLIAPNPADETVPVPGMAESWEHQSFTTWTFKIRKGATWTNGDPVTAQDFVYSFQRILSPRLGSQYAEMLHVLKNGKAFNNGSLEDFSQVGVKANDDHTLEITLEGPIPYFLNILKHSAFYPVHKGTIEKHGGIDDPANNWIREEYVGNGPFILKNWQMNQIIEVRKNPDYWDADNIHLNEIHFYPISSENTEEQTFNSGNLHYTYTVPTEMIPVYKARDDETLRIEPFFGTYYYLLNNKIKPLDNPKVRQALSYAVNRNTIVRRITKGGQEPAATFTPPGVAGYHPEPVASFNPAKARELLAEAGYPNGKGFPRLTLKFNTLESHKAIAEAVQQMWKKILGIDIDIRNQEWKVYVNAMHAGDFEIARYAWIGDYLYPDTFLRILQSDSGQNDSGYNNPQYDTLIRQSLVEEDDQKRLDLLAEAESIMLADMPVIPVYHYTRVYRIDPRVKGWIPSPLDIRNYKGIYFDAN